MVVFSRARYDGPMPIKREMPERQGQELSDEVAKKVKKTVARLKAEGLDFEIDENPDAYVVTTKREDGNLKSTYIMKLGGKLPIGGDWYGIDKFIEACLRYPEDDINIAVRKLNEKKE